MAEDHYRMLSSRSESRIRIERSEFIAVGFPVRSETEFFARLDDLADEYFDATHLCWAFRLIQDDGTRERSSDSGEPSGTAGRPILSAIAGSAVTNTAVVVIRYYGGVKLGTGGLSRAYRAAARSCLEKAPVTDRYFYDRFEVEVPYDSVSTIYRLIAPPDVVLVEETFREGPMFHLDVRRSATPHFARLLAERGLKHRRIPCAG